MSSSIEDPLLARMKKLQEFEDRIRGFLDEMGYNYIAWHALNNSRLIMEKGVSQKDLFRLKCKLEACFDLPVCSLRNKSLFGELNESISSIKVKFLRAIA